MSISRSRPSLALLVAASFAVACSSSSNSGHHVGPGVDSGSDGFVAQDSGNDTSFVQDSGFDTSQGTDAAKDSGSDVSTTPDASADATADAGGDATADAGGDATADAGGDATADAGGDATADAGGDATADAGGDATADAGGDAMADAGGDSGDGGTALVPTTCSQAHGVEGCCANGDLYWFENGTLQGYPGFCTGQGCGWDPTNNYYSCNFQGADPSGTYPIDCGGTNPDPNSCPACSCTGKSCGDDGCGNSCGTCGAGDTCNTSGQCVPQGTVCYRKSTCNATDACQCLACNTDGVCDTNEDCVCPDCANDSYCSNPNNCVNDGVCDTMNEGCECPDCAGLPICNTG